MLQGSLGAGIVDIMAGPVQILDLVGEVQLWILAYLLV